MMMEEERMKRKIQQLEARIAELEAEAISSSASAAALTSAAGKDRYFRNPEGRNVGE
jgi:hypothetical protein